MSSKSMRNCLENYLKNFLKFLTRKNKKRIKKTTFFFFGFFTEFKTTSLSLIILWKIILLFTFNDFFRMKFLWNSYSSNIFRWKSMRFFSNLKLISSLFFFYLLRIQNHEILVLQLKISRERIFLLQFFFFQSIWWDSIRLRIEQILDLIDLPVF